MSGPMAGDGRRRGISWRAAGWGLAGALLLLPLVAMRFTEEVNWGLEDLIAAAALIGGLGLALEATVRLVRRPAARLAVGLALLAIALLIWAELAVGLVT